MISILNQAVMDALEAYEFGHIKFYNKCALRTALNGISVSILDDSQSIMKFFEDAVTQEARASISLALFVLAIAREIARLWHLSPAILPKL